MSWKCSCPWRGGTRGPLKVLPNPKLPMGLWTLKRFVSDLIRVCEYMYKVKTLHTKAVFSCPGIRHDCSRFNSKGKQAHAFSAESE